MTFFSAIGLILVSTRADYAIRVIPFVGSSILIVYDYSKKDRKRLSEGDVRVAILDFKNYRQSKRMMEDEKKYRKNFREGLKNLIDLIVEYSRSI